MIVALCGYGAMDPGQCTARGRCTHRIRNRHLQGVMGSKICSMTRNACEWPSHSDGPKGRSTISRRGAGTRFGMKWPSLLIILKEDILLPNLRARAWSRRVDKLGSQCPSRAHERRARDPEVASFSVPCYVVLRRPGRLVTLFPIPP